MNYQRAVNISRLVLVLLCIVFLFSFALTGIRAGNVSIKGILEDGAILPDLDFAGGSVITFIAETEDEGEELSKNMSSILSSVRKRLGFEVMAGIDAFLTGTDKITLELPRITSPADTAALLTARAVIQIKNSDGDILLDNSDIKSAKNGYAQIENAVRNVKQLKFADEGSIKYAQATKTAAGYVTSDDADAPDEAKLSVYMDGTLFYTLTMTSDYKESGVTTGIMIIVGSFSTESASFLAAQINDGPLKYSLTNYEQRTVPATFGENALSKILTACAVGLLIIFIILIFLYRLTGASVSVSLLAFSSIFMLILSMATVRLNFAALAGIIFSLGLAVNSDVIVLNRIKEELSFGKSAKAAVNTGCQRSLPSVIDINVTFVVVSAIMYVFGTGMIRSFASMLFIGSLLSLVFAALISRLIINLVIGAGASSPSLLYMKIKTGKKLFPSFEIKTKKTVSYILAGLILIGAVSFFVRGFNTGSDFFGGSELRLELNRPVTDEICADVNSLIKNGGLFRNKYIGTAVASTSENSVLIVRTARLSEKQGESFVDSLKEKYPDADFENYRLEDVTAKKSPAFLIKAFLLLLAAVIIIFVYFRIRFDLNSALLVLIYPVFDIIVFAAVYSLFRVPLDVNSLTLFAVTLGCSAASSAVFYDRFRENKNKYGTDKPAGTIIDESYGQASSHLLTVSASVILISVFIFIFGNNYFKLLSPLLIAGLLSLFARRFSIKTIFTLFPVKIEKRKKK